MFHVVVVQQQQRNVQKRMMHVQSCCFAYLPFSLLSPLSVLKSSILVESGTKISVTFPSQKTSQCNYDKQL